MEDLSALRLSLGVRSVRTAPGQAPPPEDDEGLAAPSLAQEIHRKYAGKTQPESRQLVAILGAVQVGSRVVRGAAGQLAGSLLWWVRRASIDQCVHRLGQEGWAMCCLGCQLMVLLAPMLWRRRWCGPKAWK